MQTELLGPRAGRALAIQPSLVRIWERIRKPEMFRPLFRQEISSRRVSTYREGLKWFIFRFFEFEIFQLGAGVSKLEKMT